VPTLRRVAIGAMRLFIIGIKKGGQALGAVSSAIVGEYFLISE
jgi:hypothetical protein